MHYLDFLTQKEDTYSLVQGIKHRVINKDKKAVGVKLDNGKDIGVKKLTVSSIDPLTLVFNLIGDEYFDSNTLQNLKHYEWEMRFLLCILALDSPMEYIAGQEALQSTRSLIFQSHH